MMQPSLACRRLNRREPVQGLLKCVIAGTFGISIAPSCNLPSASGAALQPVNRVEVPSFVP